MLWLYAPVVAPIGSYNSFREVWFMSIREKLLKTIENLVDKQARVVTVTLILPRGDVYKH